MKNQWEFWIDRGGTFTDVIAHKPDGSLITCKLLSENPAQYSDAPVQGIRQIMGLDDSEPIPVDQIRAVKMGTTVATNALLERRGEPTVLAITSGFGDALRIGYQIRPDLFDLNIKLPEMLYSKVIEIIERVQADGEIIMPLDHEQTAGALKAAYDQGFRSLAVIFIHGYRHQKHERAVAKIAREIGFRQVSISCEVNPLIKLVPRGDTTVADAYLSPVLRRYISHLAEGMPGIEQKNGRLMFMQSSGGLTGADQFQGKDAVLSGPAGGIVGIVKTALTAGFNRLIGFDMGGTSTDVCHYGGEYERAFETEVAGVRLRAPMLKIHTVAAGGGSILRFSDGRCQVGPQSAGAYPGPKSYRNGGPLTVTDCNVMLGRIKPEFFPSVFGKNGKQPLDGKCIKDAFWQLAGEIHSETGGNQTPEQIANGFLVIAVENMANAIKKISVARGYDVSSYTLCCFGGAGGQHACAVADALGMSRILIHPYAGVLSALGIGLADISTTRRRQAGQLLNDDGVEAAAKLLDDCEREGRGKLLAQGLDDDEIVSHRWINLRYDGSDTVLTVAETCLQEMCAEFEILHKARFGFASPDKTLVIESVEAEVVFPSKTATVSGSTITRPDIPTPLAVEPVFMDGCRRDVPFFRREGLPVGERFTGPAILLDDTGTTVIEPGWGVTRDADDNLVAERIAALPRRMAVGATADPVMLEIFNNLFMSIAEQMGVVLENTAVSVNIKERRDFSCAVFDAAGALVANAPHMPVHLGSMSDSIKSVIQAWGRDMRHDDAFILNAPYNGGTHLPDVTVVKPVFDAEDGGILFYVASRGHHADIGGRTPGSAPADSTTIEEEGIVLDNERLVCGGVFLEQELRELLGGGRWPARNIDTNIADFKAQLAACEKGAGELLKMVASYGRDVIHAYMGHVQDNAEESVRRVLGVLSDGAFQYEMDDGSRICVKISVNRAERCATVDFSGTSHQHPGNYNAPSSIVRAAVLYVFRCLVSDPIPLNEGCLKPIEIVLPKKSILSPEYPAAVIAGNIETSQYVVDTLLGALGVAGASQGTMNNFFWGNEHFQYYETICGGAGATAEAAGADAVHTHMTNSRLTDPEILETRFPVVLESFQIRQGSGGGGWHKGGNGCIRQVRFLEPVTATILSGHRRIPPYGMAGGESGMIGHTWILRAHGNKEMLGWADKMELAAGDTIIIETPGGGGYGR